LRTCCQKEHDRDGRDNHAEAEESRKTLTADGFALNLTFFRNLQGDLFTPAFLV
jgi:hypothetical protein